MLDARRALSTYQRFLTTALKFDFIVSLCLRLYLAPIFLSAGLNKATSFTSVVEWFGNEDWGLGLPFPWLMALLATSAEIIGGLALLFGLGLRLMCLPLAVTMIVAIGGVHLKNGWFAIAPSNSDTSMAALLADVHVPGAQQSLINSDEVGERLTAIKALLKQHGNYEWLTELGPVVILNNGIEFAATYLIMIMALFMLGAGRWVSADYWIYNWATKHNSRLSHSRR